MAVSNARSPGARGLTLVETLLVVLALGGLVALALPVFGQAAERTSDRAAQVQLDHARKAGRAYFFDHDRYAADPAAMARREPSLAWTVEDLHGGSASSAVQIAVFDIPDVAKSLMLAARSRTGRCFYLLSQNAGEVPPRYGIVELGRSAACPPPDPEFAVANSWSEAQEQRLTSTTIVESDSGEGPKKPAKPKKPKA